MKKRNAPKNIVYGKAVRPNAGIRAWYRDTLVKMVKEMNETVLRRVLRVYKKYQSQIVPKAAMDANISSQEEAELRRLTQAIVKEYQDKARNSKEAERKQFWYNGKVWLVNTFSFLNFLLARY